MDNMDITCVVCPRGCSMKVNTVNGQIAEITGSGCKRGEEYAYAECTNPVRTLTTIIRVDGGCQTMAPVKSAKPVPKHLLLQCVHEINRHAVKAPVRVGDVVVPDILGTGVDIVATGNVKSFYDLQEDFTK